MVMVTVALSGAVADRPLRLGDQIPMLGDMGVEQTGLARLHVLAA